MEISLYRHKTITSLARRTAPRFGNQLLRSRSSVIAAPAGICMRPGGAVSSKKLLVRHLSVEASIATANNVRWYIGRSERCSSMLFVPVFVKDSRTRPPLADSCLADRVSLELSRCSISRLAVAERASGLHQIAGSAEATTKIWSALLRIFRGCKHPSV